MVAVGTCAVRKIRDMLCVCLLGWTICQVTPTHAAVVTLSNGDQLTGEVGKMTDGTLVFVSSVVGEVKIAWRHVARLVSDQDTRVQLQDGTHVSGQIALDAGKIVMVPKDHGSTPVTFARENLVAVNPPVVDPGVKYAVRLDVGANANRGNSADDQITLSGEFVARTPKDRYTLSVEADESRTGVEKTTSSRSVMVQYDLFLKNRDYVLFNAKTERDRFADLDSRSAFGTGYGIQFIETERVKFSGEAGVSYVFENYATEPRKSYPAMSLGLKFDRRFFDDKLIYFQNAKMDMSLDKARNTLLRHRMGIRVPIAKGLNLSTQFNVDYNNAPAIGKKKADSSLDVTIGYAY